MTLTIFVISFAVRQGVLILISLLLTTKFKARFGYREEDIVMLTDDSQHHRQIPTRENIVRATSLVRIARVLICVVVCHALACQGRPAR